MDVRHLDFTDETATCSVCHAEVGLPRDGTTWPKGRQVYLGTANYPEGRKREYMEVTDPRARPDGSEGIPMPPKWDALLEFILQHLPCAGSSRDPGGPPTPERRLASCVLGPVSLEGGQIWRVIVVRGLERNRYEFTDKADAEDFAEGAREEQAIQAEAGQ